MIPLVQKMAEFFTKIFDMSNIVCRPTRGLFGQPEKSLWLRNAINIILSCFVHLVNMICLLVEPPLKPAQGAIIGRHRCSLTFSDLY